MPPGTPKGQCQQRPPPPTVDACSEARLHPREECPAQLFPSAPQPETPSRPGLGRKGQTPDRSIESTRPQTVCAFTCAHTLDDRCCFGFYLISDLPSRKQVACSHPVERRFATL